MGERVLHVINGDAMRAALFDSGVSGEISVYADILHEGPVPPDDDMAAWLATRARFIADSGYADYEFALETGTRWQSAFDRHAEYDRIVLWFEHDLFCQLLLVRHLAFLARVGRFAGVELICGDQYLGLLNAEEMAVKYSTRESVGRDQFDLAAKLWRAFTSSDPAPLRSIQQEDLSALPYSSAAIQRMLEEYPSTRNGLGRIDNQILTLLMERERSFDELFVANNKLEEAYFLGDLIFRTHLESLANARVPLVMMGDVIRITEAGRAVAAGDSNALRLNGVDRWVGGVHFYAA